MWMSCAGLPACLTGSSLRWPLRTTKKTLFSLDQRVGLVQAATKTMANVTALPFDGLIMDFCAQQNACAVVRGIRNITDFDYEARWPP